MLALNQPNCGLLLRPWTIVKNTLEARLTFKESHYDGHGQSFRSLQVLVLEFQVSSELKQDLIQQLKDRVWFAKGEHFLFIPSTWHRVWQRFMKRNEKMNGCNLKTNESSEAWEVLDFRRQDDPRLHLLVRDIPDSRGCQAQYS